MTFELFGIDLGRARISRVGGQMLLEESPSGANLFMYPAGKREEAVTLSRADVQTLAELFKLLDAWDREAKEMAPKEKRR